MLAWHSKFGKDKARHKELNEELMFTVWHPRRWFHFCMSGDEKKETDLIFTE